MPLAVTESLTVGMTCHLHSLVVTRKQPGPPAGRDCQTAWQPECQWTGGDRDRPRPRRVPGRPGGGAQDRARPYHDQPKLGPRVSVTVDGLQVGRCH